MPYALEKQTAPTHTEDVADIYVVRGVEALPSRELLSALERSAPEELSLVQEIAEIGLHAMAKR